MIYIFNIIICVFIDQISKILVKFYLYNDQMNVFGSILRFTYIENRGIAFGIDTSQYHLFITILTISAIILIIYYLINTAEQNDKLPLSFIIGGAIGNAIDRILVLFPSSGYIGVVDFIDIGINNYRWYIFNMADTFITIGIIIYFILQLKNQSNATK